MKTPLNDTHSTPNPDLLDASHYRQFLAGLPFKPTVEGQNYRDNSPPKPSARVVRGGDRAAHPLPISTAPPTASSPSPQPSPPPATSNGPLSYIQYLVAGGCILAALALMTDVQSFVPTPRTRELCQTVLQPDAVLSRPHLAQLLAVSERSPKATVRQVIAEPYCQLPMVQLRAGVQAEREAYPLEFDPDTWFVVLYEGDEYAGFDFSFRR